MKKIIGIILTLIGIVTTAINLLLKVKGKMSVSITGGADGPTSVFVAGKIGGTSTVIGIILGIALLTAGIFIIARKK